MKQINTINRFLTGLGAAVVLFGSTLLFPSGALAQSKSSSGASNQKEESTKAIQPKKVKQHSLSNQRPVEKRNVPATNVDAKTNRVVGAQSAPIAADRAKAIEEKKAKQKAQNIEQEKLAKADAKKSPQVTAVSMSNKAPGATSQQNVVESKSANKSPNNTTNAQEDWKVKREKTKSLLLAKGLSPAEVEKKLQEMDKQVQSSKK